MFSEGDTDTTGGIGGSILSEELLIGPGLGPGLGPVIQQKRLRTPFENQRRKMGPTQPVRCGLGEVPVRRPRSQGQNHSLVGQSLRVPAVPARTSWSPR